MKKILLYSIAAIALLNSCHKETFDEKVAREINTFNEKEAPKQIDPYTTEDSINWNPTDRTITYCYTISGELDNEELMTPKAKNLFREQLEKNVKGSIQLKPYKEQGLNFEYKYFSKKSGKVLVDELFTKENY